MKTKTYNNQTINAYLLGTLPEAEMELFDELSFTDDDFADELKVAEKDLVDAFVQGELDGEKLKHFNTYYLASPLRREKVEFAQTFQTFAEKELAQETVEAEPKAGFFANLFAIPRLSLQWGFALTTLALMFFGGWMIWENSRLRSEISQTQSNRDELLKRESELAEREKQLQNEIATQQTVNAETEKELAKIRDEREKLAQELKKSQEQKRMVEPSEPQSERAEVQKTPVPPNRQISIASFILSPSLRGNNQLPTLSIPPKTDLVAMQLQLESDDYKTYRTVLQNQSGQTLWQSGKLRAAGGAEKVLNLRFPAKLLKSGIYLLEVSGVSPAGKSEIIGNYSFKI
jgi:flagellar biosynthesis GTPase FlhF